MMYNYNVYAAMHQLGVTRLRTEQSKVLTCILQNRDVLVRLCTGGGKSLLFQLPALLDEPGQLTLVFSPLLALQEDQVSALKKKGVRAALLNSSLSKRRHAATLRDFVQNGGLLYLAPEQLRREDVRAQHRTGAPRCRGRGAHPAAGRPRFSPGLRRDRRVHQVASHTAANPCVHGNGDRFRLQLYRTKPAYG